MQLMPCKPNSTDKYTFQTTPYKHQLEVWEASKDRETFALLMEMGTGKSRIIIDTAAWLYEHGRINCLLVTANKGSYLNWYEELEKHMPERVPYQVYHWDSANSAKSAGYVGQAVKGTTHLVILLLNVEALQRQGAAYKAARRLLSCKRAMMVVDESTTIANPKAKRTKNVIALGKLALYRRILTGQPVANSPLNIYSQCYFLDQRLLGYKSYVAFRHVYADVIQIHLPNRPSFPKINGYRNLEELGRRLREFSAIINKEDCLDLPPKVYETVNVELTPEQRKLYGELRDNAVTELSDIIEAEGVVTGREVITRLLRLHQLVCGFVPDLDGKLHPVPSLREQAMMQVLGEMNPDRKVIIWATYRWNIHQLTAKLTEEFGEQSVASYYGDTKLADRKLIIARFQRDPRLKYLVANPAVGGYGLTLTEAYNAIYYSNSYDASLRGQSEDRLHRIGQTQSVTYIDLIARGTVDEKILGILQQKKRLADLVLNSDVLDLFDQGTHWE